MNAGIYPQLRLYLLLHAMADSYVKCLVRQMMHAGWWTVAGSRLFPHRTNSNPSVLHSFVVWSKNTHFGFLPCFPKRCICVTDMGNETSTPPYASRSIGEPEASRKSAPWTVAKGSGYYCRKCTTCFLQPFRSSQWTRNFSSPIINFDSLTDRLIRQ